MIHGMNDKNSSWSCAAIIVRQDLIIGRLRLASQTHFRKEEKSLHRWF